MTEEASVEEEITKEPIAFPRSPLLQQSWIPCLHCFRMALVSFFVGDQHVKGLGCNWCGQFIVPPAIIYSEEEE